MKKLTIAEVRELLLRNEAENAEYIDEIGWHERNNVDAEYYLMDGVAVLAVSFRGAETTDLIPAEENFDILSACRWAVENRGNTAISICAQHLDETCKKAAEEILAATHTFTKTTVCYRYTSCELPGTDAQISHLTLDDKEAFVHMEFTKEPNRPTQEILFNHYLVEEREEGGILTYREKDVILGYLAYYRVSGKQYATDYIWVAPSRRKEGIGGKLTDAYIALVLQAGNVPTWSNPATEISANLAKTHGFEPFLETMRFQAK